MTLELHGNPRQASSRRWEIRRGPDVYVCELVVVDGCWAEARVSKNGDLIGSHRSHDGWETIAWAEAQRKDLEKGGA
jgi:hypothetical protein